MSNLAVAGSATQETRIDNNVDGDSVRVRSQGGVLPERCAHRAGVAAHMAC